MQKFIKRSSILKIITLSVFMLSVTMAQAYDFSPYKGSYVEAGHTLGAISEFKNRHKIDSSRFKAKVNVAYGHVVYNHQSIVSKGAAKGALHNRDWQWMGVGLHTNKGTDFTFYKDLKDTKNKFWKVEIIHTNRVRSRLSTLVGIHHYDTEHGNLIDSGGRRTTAVYTGLMFHATKNVSVLADMTVGNNGSDFIQDVIMLNLRFNI